MGFTSSTSSQALLATGILRLVQLLEQLTQECAAGGSQPSPASAATTEAPLRALLGVAAATVATVAAVERTAREGGVAPPPAWGLKKLAEGTPGFPVRWWLLG